MSTHFFSVNYFLLIALARINSLLIFILTMKNKFKLDLKESSSNFNQSSKIFSEKEVSRMARMPSESGELSLTLQSDFLNESFVSNAISSFHFDHLRKDVKLAQNNIQKNKNEQQSTKIYLDELQNKSQRVAEKIPYLPGNYEDVRQKLNNVANRNTSSQPDPRIKSGHSTKSDRESFSHYVVQKRNFTKGNSKTQHKISVSPEKDSPDYQLNSHQHHSHFLSASKHQSRSQSEAPMRINPKSSRQSSVNLPKRNRVTDTKKRFRSSSQTRTNKKVTNRQKLIDNYRRLMNSKPQEVKVYNNQLRDPRTGLPKRVRIRPLFLWLGERIVATGNNYTLVKMVTKID